MSSSKRKKWLVNILILLITVVLMLAVTEVAMRWLDGYQLSTFELQQDPTTDQPVD